MCNEDCFNCIKPDCDVDVDLANANNCKRWYEKHKEQKKAYQRGYQRKKRAADKFVKESNGEWVSVFEDVPVVDRNLTNAKVSVDVICKTVLGDEQKGWLFYDKCEWYNFQGNLIRDVVAWRSLYERTNDNI